MIGALAGLLGVFVGIVIGIRLERHRIIKTIQNDPRRESLRKVAEDLQMSKVRRRSRTER